MPGSVARRYARALYQLAVEEDAVEAVAEALADMAVAVETVAAEGLAQGLLDRVQRGRMAASMAESLGSATIVGRFLGVLAERDRLGELPAICESYVALEDQAAGRVRMAVATAMALADEELDNLKSTFQARTGHEIVAETSIDAGLIAGAVVEIEGRVFDGTVRSYLDRLGAAMAGGRRAAASGTKE